MAQSLNDSITSVALIFPKFPVVELVFSPTLIHARTAMYTIDLREAIGQRICKALSLRLRLTKRMGVVSSKRWSTRQQRRFVGVHQQGVRMCVFRHPIPAT